MSIDQFMTEFQELRTRRSDSRKEEKILLQDIRQKLSLLTELFREGVHDFVLRIGQEESLEWDARLNRFIYHRRDASQFLELARPEILFRICPYLQDLMKKARETLE